MQSVNLLLCIIIFMYFVSKGLCRYVGSFSELQFLLLILREGLQSSFDEIIYNYDILPSDIHLAARWSLSDPNLLKGMPKGKTQNSNLHSVAWICCTKSVFVGQRKLKSAVARAVSSLVNQTEVCSSSCCVFVVQRKLKSAVARAVASFNAGASHLAEVMDLPMRWRRHSLKKQTCCASLKSNDSAKMQRKSKTDARKLACTLNEGAEGTLYLAGDRCNRNLVSNQQ